MMKRIVIIILFSSISCLFATNWQAQISVTTDYAADETNYFGKHENGSSLHDNLDICDMPFSPFPPYVLLYFPHSNWGAWAGNYSKDIRSDSLQTEVWIGETKANPSNNQNYSFTWQDIDEIPGYYDIFFSMNSSSLDMRLETEFTFSSNSQYNQFQIELTPNNFPPVIIDQIGSIEITENLSYILDNISNHFFDEDSLQFQVENSEHISSEFLSRDQLKIIPQEAWYGEEVIILQAMDMYFTTEMEIPVSVQPSEPKAIENIQISQGIAQFQISWDAVNLDINNNPIQDVFYRVYQVDIETMIPILISETVNCSTFVGLDDKKFFQITSVNGESIAKKKSIK